MKKILLFRLIFIMVFGLFGFNITKAHAEVAFQNLELGSLTVSSAETKSISLHSARYIKNIIVQAEGVSTHSTIEVMVNGEIKGTIFAPGRDPSYVVTIAETVTSLEFRHRDGGSMKIHSILATVSQWQGRVSPNERYPIYGYEGEAYSLAQRALVAVERLKYLSQPSDEAFYLYPIKKQAGFVMVYTDARGSHSKKAIQALIALQNQIDFARSYIEGLMQTEEGFEAAVEILTVRESIDELLD